MSQNNLFEHVQDDQDDSAYMLNNQQDVMGMSRGMFIQDQGVDEHAHVENNNQNVMNHFENILKSVSYAIEDINAVPENDLIELVYMLYREWQLEQRECFEHFESSDDYQKKVQNISNRLFQKFSSIFVLDWDRISNSKSYEQTARNPSIAANNDAIHQITGASSNSVAPRISNRSDLTSVETDEIATYMEGKVNPQNMMTMLETNFKMRIKQIKSISNEVQYNRMRIIEKTKEKDDFHYLSYKSMIERQDIIVKMIEDIYFVLHFGFNKLKADIMLICYNQGFCIENRIKDDELIKKLDYEGKTLKDQAKLLLRSIGHMKKMGYAKKKPDVLCRQKYIDIEVENELGDTIKKKMPTHCWVDMDKHESIENVLQEWASIDQSDMSKWSEMFGNVNTMKNVITMLFNQRTHEFPTIETITTLYSFRNGLLCLDADDKDTIKYFGSYEDMTKIQGVSCNCMETEFYLVSLPTNHKQYRKPRHPEEKVKGSSIRYWFAPYTSLSYVEKRNENNMDRMTSNVFIDETFDQSMIDMSIEQDDPMFFEKHIKCDQMQRIFDGQKYSNELVRDLYALVFGRILQPYHKHDEAHIVPALLGMGGSGKSVILKTLRSFFQPNCIAVLSAGQQKEFGMEKLIGKKIWIYDEMEKESNVGFDVFKQLASGEVISVNQKYGKSVDEKDTKAGIFCGNELANNFEDSQGQASRRIAVFLFTETAGKKQDETLERKILAQRSQIIMRGFYSYFHLVNRINSKMRRMMWSVLAKELVEYQQVIQSRKNTVVGFLKEEGSLLGICDKTDVGSQSISYNEFVDKYKCYCRANRIPTRKTLSNYTDIMIALKAVSIPIVEMESTKGKMEKFVCGLYRNENSSMKSLFESKNSYSSYPVPLSEYYDDSYNKEKETEESSDNCIQAQVSIVRNIDPEDETDDRHREDRMQIDNDDGISFEVEDLD